LCEEFIDGEELTCPVIGNGIHTRALPVVRIAAPDGAYDYNNKYFTDDVKYHCPSGLPEAEEKAIQALVVSCLPCTRLSRLGSCRHYVARIRSKTLFTGDEYIARYDQPFIGADVSQSCWHQL
jgi:hypothetical protein